MIRLARSCNTDADEENYDDDVLYCAVLWWLSLVTLSGCGNAAVMMDGNGGGCRSCVDLSSCC